MDRKHYKSIYSLSVIELLFIVLLLFVSGCHSKNDNEQELVQSSGELHLLVKKYDRYLTTANDSSRVILPVLLQKLDSIIAVNPDSAVAVLAHIAGRESEKGDIHLADSLSDLALSQAYKLNNSALISTALNVRGKVIDQQEIADSALYYFSKALHVAKLSHDSAVILPPMINLGNVMVNRGKITVGISYLEEALSIAKKRNERQDIAILYSILGNAYEIRGSYAAALHYYKSAIDTFESIGSKQNYLTPLNNLANIYLYLGSDSLAMEYYQKVDKLSEAKNDKLMRAYALCNIGNLYYENGQDSLALIYTKKGLKMASGEVDTYLHSVIYLNLGLIHRNLGLVDTSFHEISKSVSIAQQYGIFDVLAEGQMELARYFEKNKEYHQSIKLALEAYQNADVNRMLSLLPGTTRLLAEIYRKVGHEKKALRYYDLYSTYNKQYQDTLNNKQTRNYAFLYEIEKKEAANKLLIQQQQLDKQVLTNVNLELEQQRILIIFSIITIISILLIAILLYYRSRLKSSLNEALILNNNEITEQNNLLEKENAFKNKLISIISHDIKSPMMSLYNILELLSVDELSEEEKRELIRDNMQLTDRALNMVEDLLSWTRQQLNTTTVNYTTINVYDLGNEIITFFQPDAREMNINLVNACSPETTVYSDYQMLKMVIRNLFSNAMKFTPSGGYIEMGVSKTNGNVILYVADTGVGIKPEDQSKIFSEEKYFTTNGVRGERGNGLGLKLCRNFVEKSGGKIWLESDPGKGSTFFIEISRTGNSLSL